MLLTLNRMRAGRYVLYTIGILTALFFLLPIVAIVVLSFGSSRWMQFPPPGWTMRWYNEVAADPRWLDAFATSAQIAAVVTILSVTFGLGAALALVRGQFRGKNLINGLFVSPMMVPVVISAVALYIVSLRVGLNGTFAGYVAGHLILALPFSVISLVNALSAFDVSIEKAAIICGASPTTAFRRVTIPAISGGLATAAIFSFLISWDEVVISTFMSSASLRTLPILMWTSVHQDLSPVIAAVSTILICITLVVVVAFQLFQRNDRNED
ncbi:ABC transporter permease [Rhizobium sp. 2MFCol3.1]|uniref:ABC transporter permease n=1 Tax=Rhizobium sp. 2MFCol3.1 TaxID=1246459 RepID=UPI000475CDDD|nr:ABC transporter permease [Rhizobium sp. 2MFCol3.1]